MSPGPAPQQQGCGAVNLLVLPAMVAGAVGGWVVGRPFGVAVGVLGVPAGAVLAIPALGLLLAAVVGPVFLWERLTRRNSPAEGNAMGALGVTHIDHVSVLVTDAARSRAFYAGVLGLKEIPKPKEFDFAALWFDLGGGQTLHLLRKPQPDARSPRHFALAVPDARAARAHFARHAVPTEETTAIAGCDRFFVYDPDGNRIELIRWLTPYDPAAGGAAALDE